MIKTVVDMRGAKRFKKKPGEGNVDFASGNDLPIDNLNLQNVKEVFRKM